LTKALRRQGKLAAQRVYECPDCAQRFLGEQRCPDCNRFCRGLGLGGRCPHCDDLVLLSELLEA
jgi:DNA-directed RNA polymerase subunit RPC12/RpoP